MSYDEHRSRLHEKATVEYKKWYNSLTRKERKKLKSKGLNEAPVDKEAVGGKAPTQTQDFAESSLASYTPDIATEVDSLQEELAERFGVSIDKAEEILAWHYQASEHDSLLREARRTQHIVAGILMSDNPRLSCAGLAFATNLDTLNNLNQTEWAKQFNISKSNISKETKHWQTLLNLNTSVHQKSTEACQTYSANKKRKHWRSSIFKNRNKKNK